MVIARSELVRILKTLMNEETPIELCILYGSGARDRLSKSSDVDIAIAASHRLDNNYLIDL